MIAVTKAAIILAVALFATVYGVGLYKAFDMMGKYEWMSPKRDP